MVSVIIPAYNEEAYLPATLSALDRNRFWDEVIIVNDGSIDKTSTVSLPNNVFMVSHSKNRGKGYAIETGLKKSSGDIIMFLDADLGASAILGDHLLTPVIERTADMTIAKFPPAGKGGGFGIVKQIATHGIKYFTGKIISEPLSGQRSMRRSLLEVVHNYHYGYGFEVALTLDVLRAGHSICEVDIPFEHRQMGRNWRGFYHRGNESVQILKTLWQKRESPC